MPGLFSQRTDQDHLDFVIHEVQPSCKMGRMNLLLGREKSRVLEIPRLGWFPKWIPKGLFPSSLRRCGYQQTRVHNILPEIPVLSGDTLRNCLSQTNILRHILRHTLRPSHVPLHHPTPPTLSIHLTFPHTIGNSIPVEQSFLCDSLWLSLWLSPSWT